MPSEFTRKPIGNFFIKRDLQLRLISKVMLAVLLATLIFAATILIVYLIKYQSVGFYRVTLFTGDADISDRENIVFILLPAIVISSIVNVFVAFAVGLYASRKYAVPIYKLEQWVSLLLEGNMAAKLRFREKEEMRELSTNCNKLSESLRSKFVQLKAQTQSLRKSGNDTDELKEMEKILLSLELESETIEVHTTFARMVDLEGDKKDSPENGK